MYRHVCSLKRYTEVLAEGCLVLCDIQSSLFLSEPTYSSSANSLEIVR